MNVNPIKLNITIWPAVIAANNLIVKDIGFVKTPIISIGKIKNLIAKGIPGVQKICFQRGLLKEK